MNMFGIFVHNTSDCLQTVANLLQQTYLMVLERGKRISYHRTKFRRNFVQAHLRANHVYSGPFSVHVHGDATPQIPYHKKA